MRAEILGKLIGHSKDVEECDFNTVFFYQLKLNEFGKSFMPTFSDGGSIWINFTTGETGYTETPDSEEESIKLHWTIFDH